MSTVITAGIVILITTLLILVVRYGSPIILRGIFPQLQVSSVSPRSVRGLRWDGGAFRLSVERIGFGLHRPSAERTSWISIQVEKFDLQVLKRRRTLNRSKPNIPRFLTEAVPTEHPEFQNIADKEQVSAPVSLVKLLDADEEYAPPLAILSWVLPISYIQSIDRFLRPFFRVLLTQTLRTLFRALPSVTQLVQFEMDLCTITIEELNGAGVTISDVKVNTLVELQQMEDVPIDDLECDQGSAAAASGASRLTARMQSGMARLWNRAWGNAKGLARLKVSVRNVKAFCGDSEESSVERSSSLTPIPTATPTPFTSTTQSFSDMSTSTATGFFPKPVSSPSSPSSASIPPTPRNGPAIANTPLCLLFPPNLLFITHEEATVVMSMTLEPRRGIIGEGSISIDVNVPPAYMSVGALRRVGNALKKDSDEIGQQRDDTFSPALSPELSPTDSEDGQMPNWSTGFRTPITPGGSISRRLRSLAQSARKRAKVTKPKARPIAWRISQLLDYVHVHLQTVDMAFDLEDSTHGDNMTMSLKISELQTHLEMSDPTRSDHREWLGKKGNRGDGSDFSAFAFSVNAESFAVDRVSTFGILDGPTSLIDIRGVAFDLLTTAVPGQRAEESLFAQDENASFVICTTVVESVNVYDELDTLQRTMRLLNPAKPPRPLSPRSDLHNLPCVVLGLEVRTFGVHLGISPHEEGNDLDRRLFISLRNSGLSFNAQSAYVDLCTRAGLYQPGKAYCGEDPRRLDREELYSLRYDFTVDSAIAPFTVQLCHSKTDNVKEPLQIEGEIFSIGAFELGVVGHTLGSTSLAPSKYTSSLDISSTMSDIRIAVDYIAIDIWKPSVVDALRGAMDRHRPTPSTIPRLSGGSLLDKLPIGVCFYSSIGYITVLVAGEDPTISENINISRGVILRSGLVLQYCFYQTLRHTTRTKKQLGLTHSRQQLSLQEDLAAQAAAVANDVNYPDEFAALSGISLWDTSLRPVVNAEKDSPLYRTSKVPANAYPKLKDAVICSSPRLTIRVLLRKQRTTSSATHPHDESCDVMVEGPMLSIHAKLLHVFCLLLAWKNVPVRRHNRPEKEPKARRMASGKLEISFRANIEVVDMACHLHSKDRLYFRLGRLASEWKEGITAVRWASLYAWVPSPELEGKWEEFLRLRDWNLSITAASQSRPRMFDVSGKGARIHIPYRYVVYELTQGITISIKAIGHLLRCMRAGTFHEPPIPTAKAPRQVPDIRIHIDTLTMEAVDAPFESRLNLIWRTGHKEQLARMERELAFEAKVQAVNGFFEERPGSRASTAASTVGYTFSGQHSVSVEEAYNRLLLYNSQAWIKRHKYTKAERDRKEDGVYKSIHGTPYHFGPFSLPISVHTPDKAAPLLRIIFNGLDLSLAKPSFPLEQLPQFLQDVGRGIPLDTEYTLLIPMSVRWDMEDARITLRDYPLPLFHVPSKGNKGEPRWSLTSNFVIAEQVGPPSCITFIKTEVVPADTGLDGTPGLWFSMPKTCMPIKTLAEPQVYIRTSAVTEFAWGVSYNPAIHDVMRMLDSITSPPKDPSPTLGFWDKLRLVFHWRIKLDFARSGVHFHIKGSRDPYHVSDVGAGFALCWQGSPSISIGYSEQDQELIQVSSDRMSLVIPNLTHLDIQDQPPPETPNMPMSEDHPKRFRKVCAKFTNGVRWGIGFKLERTCRTEECDKCKGSIFHRQCRFFYFRPHWTVHLRAPPQGEKPEGGWPDSYAGFRSDFIHMGLSITSPTRNATMQGTSARTNGAGLSGYNSAHLTPKGFAHFFSWWRLFDGTMSVPIRQGKLFPSIKPPSKKFGKHLATIKYRVSLSPLVISHNYRQDSRSQWVRGETGAVGIKAMVEQFQADLHQRLQEVVIFHEKLQTTKRRVRKRFCAADVTLTNVEMRTMAAVFSEPEKTTVVDGIDDDDSAEAESHFSFVCDEVEPGWFDLDDFVDVDWSPSDHKPKIRLLRIGTCPRFSFSKRANARRLNRRSSDHSSNSGMEVTKFGDEDTHICLAGQADDAYQVQISLTSKRVAELESELEELLRTKRESKRVHQINDDSIDKPGSSLMDREADLLMKIRLLREYITRLKSAEQQAGADGGINHSFFEQGAFVPSNSDTNNGASTSQDWKNFDNVYEAHFPTIFLNNDTRNVLISDIPLESPALDEDLQVLLDYYYSSRAHRGLEYHMTERAIKFIRDHAKPVNDIPPEADEFRASSQPALGTSSQTGRVQGAAQGLFRLFTHDGRASDDSPRWRPHHTDDIFEDPHTGWLDDVLIRKSHIARLIKPQVVLRSDLNADSITVVAIRSVYIRNFTVLDREHLDDPINGPIMQRNYFSLSGLQAFYPARDQVLATSHVFVPLEVLLDLRSETRDFERLVPYTDAKLHYDKFNQLRLRKNMRTASVDNLSRRNEHLKLNMDRLVIGIPSFSVSADARNFTAVYNVATDLLLYRDPAQKARSQKLKTFLYSYDFTDLDSAADVVSGLQRRMRYLAEVENANILKPPHEGAMQEQLAIRAEMQNLAEELSFIFEAIKLKQDKAGGRTVEGDSSAVRVETYVSDISWMMLDPRHALLAKLSVKGIVFSWLNRKDGSADSTLELDDLLALNSTPEALFPEILCKYERPATHPMVRSGKFVRASWSTLAPVSGISIIRSFELHFHPIRLQIERKVGRQIMDYIFARSARRKEIEGPDRPVARSNGSGTSASTPRSSVFPLSKRHSSGPQEVERSTDEVGKLQKPRVILNRPSSFQDVTRAGSGPHPKSLKHVSSSEALLSASSPTENRDALEMRTRAAQNRTFLEINVASSVLVLSYKSEKTKSITDLYDFRFQVPSFQYHNQTWSFEDVVQQLRRDVIKAAWQQKGALFKEVVTKSRRPQHLLQQSRQNSEASRKSQSSIDSHQSIDSLNGKKSRASKLWHALQKRGKGKASGQPEPRLPSSLPPTLPASSRSSSLSIIQSASTNSDNEGRREHQNDGGTIERWIEDDKEEHFRSVSPDPLGSDTSSPSVTFPEEEEEVDEFDRRISLDMPQGRRPSVRRRTVSNIN
ncbi:hypothetical protein DACRYDRAFT_97695 [Dacryopinax primogenitus]|uniref:Golgi-body localization protein domain-containing protein n=1 Tax=Dacryopinax primogenitus (strain DJM 731) TaxID=1858805 RepID=M5GB07_DACPD|nr:uncharacterized protein DACRYDRAFT_97695 [Dacryopinax primogenitus]EJU06094.1 hypothetical protein DACRYDRAFT_97695 [Dacryopinax primogenitus]